MRKIKTLLITAFLIFSAVSAFAVEATVTFVSGKVEVQRGGKWIPLQKGDTVSKSETISTGFQSEAKIKIIDSVMYLGPVTRITLEELSSTGQKDNVNVYLKTGTSRSQVKHVDNKRVNYQVHTAVAVASCRGTGWIIDDSNIVDCYEGVVAVAVYKEGTSGIVKFVDDDGTESEVAAEDAIEAGADEVAIEDERSIPTSDDGVLVTANQTVAVSERNTVSAPVHTVVKTATEITSNVASVAQKEKEGGVTFGGGTAALDAGSGSGLNKQTATVVVILEFPSE